MEEIYFTNSSGEKLSGIIEFPPHSDYSPVVVICHGFGGNRQNQYIRDIAAKMNENNIAAFSFDFSAHGKSEGNFFNSGVSKWADDLENAFAAVSKLKKIDLSRTAMFGFSLGGMASVIAAPKLRPKCIVAASSVSDFTKVKWETFLGKQAKKWEKKGYVELDGKKLSYNFYQDGVSKDIYKTAKTIASPALVIHGEKDSIVPVSQAKKLFSSLKCEKKLEIVKGADHSGLNANQYNHFIAETTRWIVGKLQE